jgi:hypothetical protein
MTCAVKLFLTAHSRRKQFCAVIMSALGKPMAQMGCATRVSVTARSQRMAHRQRSGRDKSRHHAGQLLTWSINLGRPKSTIGHTNCDSGYSRSMCNTVMVA